MIPTRCTGRVLGLQPEVSISRVKYANWNYPGSERTNIVLERHGPHASRHRRGDKSTASGRRFTCAVGSFVFGEDGERNVDEGGGNGGTDAKDAR